MEAHNSEVGTKRHLLGEEAEVTGLTSGHLNVQTVLRPTHQLDTASATAD